MVRIRSVAGTASGLTSAMAGAAAKPADTDGELVSDEPLQNQ
jgi:hypothetical protein